MNSSIFIQQSLNFQFLSVCHYITIFGVYFYNKNLITIEEQKQSVTILNTLFEYLNKSQDESEAKFQLLKKVLKGSDLYGGEENETLDMKYINETYHYIISKALFYHYGNINGYLAKIINSADDINYSVLKEKVFQHLLKNYTTREYCFDDVTLGNYGSNNITLGNYSSNDISSRNYSSKLNGLTVQKVFNDYIWPIFPQPKKDMSIIDVDYIYAMVGLKIIKSVSSTSPNFTFQDYILISREIDLQDFNNETYQMVLNLYSTPALFFYAYIQKAKFQQINCTLTDEFWIEAYENLFIHINLTMNQIVQGEIENSLLYKFNREISNLKSRTTIAVEILKKYCDYEHIVKVPSPNVDVYKTFYLWITKLILPKECKKFNLPDLEKEYKAQFVEIEKIYINIVKDAIQKVLINSNLREILNSNATVKSAQVPNYANEYIIIPRKKNDDIFFLFAIEEKNRNFYAFKQVNNVLSILSSRENEQEFAKAIANDSSIKMEIPRFYQIFKYNNEDQREFIQRVAVIKAKEFVNNLMMHNYDETFGEKVLNFASSLIPFYSCIENANEGKVADATLSCALDIVSLIPLAGFAAKYSAKLGNSLTIEISKNHQITKTLSKTVVTKVPVTSVINQLSQIAVRTIAREILTKKVLKDLTIASLQTLDPGFEFIYRIGLQSFARLFQSIITNFSNRRVLLLVKSLMKSLKQNKKLNLDHTGLVLSILSNHNDYNIIRYFYPGGSHFFGPKCLTAGGKTMELRSIDGYSFPIPVIEVKSGIYKQFIPESDRIFNNKLKLGDNDILQRVGYLLDQMIIAGRDINIIRNYHVYHNTENQMKSSAKTSESTLVNSNLPHGISERNSQIENSGISGENTVENNYQRFTNTEFQVHLRGNLDRSNHPQITNIEFIGTLRGNIGSENFAQLPEREGVIIKTESNSPEINSLYSMSLRDLLNNGDKPPERGILNQNSPEIFQFGNIQQISNIETPKNDGIPLKKQKIETEKNDVIPYRHKKFDNKNRKTKTEIEEEINDNIPSTSRQSTFNVLPMIYRSILREPTYTKYIDILMLWKNNGLSFIKLDTTKINFLRTAVNKLAILQYEQGLGMQKQMKFWYSHMVIGQNNIDLLANLKGNTFFFNDLTLLTNKPLGPLKRSHKFKFHSEIEVRYHIQIDDSTYGFVDLTKFHQKFENNYLTFNDVLFKVTDTFFTPDNKILNIKLKPQYLEKELWLKNRETEILNLNLNKNEITKNLRMKLITNAAHIMSENALLCTFELSRDFLANIILSKTINNNNQIPTYNMLAEDFKTLNFRYNYRNWQIQNNPYIKDILLSENLDKIIQLSEAKRRIHELYDLVYFQNIDEAFENYHKIPNIEENLRFEDYYVLYSHVKNKLITNKDGIRRFEAAINRLGLRQCDNNDYSLIMRSIKLYRGEMITMELAEKLMKTLKKTEIIKFDKFKNFSPSESVVVVNCLNNVGESTQIPLIMEVDLTNQAGIVNVGQALNEEIPLFIATANFQYVLNDIGMKKIFDQDVLVMKMQDYDSPIETRMVQMATRLNELFSTETKFYSES
ncbi:uncharacterized protein LOC127277504 [Leptopilina boulardi]|uniref:uncharacterized protein LOC127277504 n=1 Tax=Leptopilina boulardi TaxID=63433 RepID=UPI0021F64682|nr:uncharacterized protein LOC127277504 [Leptopilina boulardi]XP_051154628.1 uncharacterized protein LOC127277504 [Leptopilina boulardi]XP_051154629.1 uncharacterized protein LOC127277504 [Leptopilina boulardi]